jgi:PAS domain S-box-containing protein
MIPTTDEERVLPRGVGKYLAQIAMVFAVQFAAGKLGDALAIINSGGIGPVWPASGTALAALLLFGYQVWPGVAAGAFLLAFLSPIPQLAAVVYAAGTTLAALTGAFLLRRVVNFRASLSRLRDALGMIVLGAFGSSVVSASIGASTLYAAHIRGWSGLGSAWLIYWLGDSTGVLVVTPLVLTLPTLFRIRDRHRLTEFAVLLLLLMATSFATFGLLPISPGRVRHLAFAVLPFVMWAAIRLGMGATALSILVLATIATVETALGSGPFSTNTPLMNAVLLDIFFAVVSVTGLTLAAAIAEREQAERQREQLVRDQAAMEARLRLATIVESSDDAIISKNLERVITSWNAGAQRVFGFTEAEAVGQPITILVPPDLQDEENDILQRLRAGDHIEHLETIRVAKTGKRVDVSLSISPIKDATGRVVGASIIARDITERKRADEALRKSEERFRLAAQAGRMFAYEWDAATDLIVRSPESVQILGIDEATLTTGRQILTSVHPDDRERLETAIAELSSERPYLQISYRILRPDGTVIWVERNSRAHFDEQGRLLRIVGMVADITERKQAEEALKRSELNYRLFVAQSSEGIFCQELERPIPVNLPEDEQVQRILHESYLAECNDALARMYGMSLADFVGKRLTETLDAENPVNIELTRDYIRGGYRVVDRESNEVDREGNPKVFLNSMIGIVENGVLLRTWGIQRDVTDRRRAEQARLHAEQALRESEQRFRLATQAGKMYAYEWDVASDRVVRSEEYANVLGFDDQPKQLTRQQLLARVQADDRELFATSVDKLSPENPTIQISYRVSRPDGSLVWLEKSARAFFDEQGRMLSVTGIVADITERKRAEEALRESEARERARVKELETILDAVPVPVRIAHDAACRWMTGNRAAYELAHVPVGRNVSSSAPPAEGPRYRLMEDGVQVAADMLPMQQAAATGKPVYGRALTVVYENGTKRETVENAVPLLDEAGKPRGAVGTSIDLTEQKEAEDKFRLLLDSTAEAIYGIDLEHRCTFCNPACLRALGYERINEVLGRNMDELMHHTRPDGTLFPVEECRVHQVIRTGEGVHADDEVLWRANGTSFPAEYWSYPQRRGRELVGAVVAFTDITQRKLAEAALANVSRRLIEAQEKERTRIARELHDDIGQRLALLTIELERLQENSPDLPVEVRGRMGELHKQTSEMATDIQTLSHELHSAKLEYLGLAAAMRGFCKEFGEQQNVEIDFKIPDLPSPLSPDISLCLFRVLQEALHNSAKHSGVRHIEVGLWGTADEIHLAVSDSGAGFDSEAVKESRGLGLISMEERLKLVKGTFSIESQPKRGTTIHARVPLSSGSDFMRAAG